MRLTYRAASRSSIVTPQPPGNAWLGPIGHGLAMSKNRNSNTMATDQCQVVSPKKNRHSGIVPFVKFSDETQPAKQSGAATISSMTTEPGSRWSRIVSAQPQNQTDATLVGRDGEDLVLLVEDAPRQWRIPARSECMMCHSRAAQYVLGLNELQMNREHDYGNFKAHQFQVLDQLGIEQVVKNLRERGEKI